MYKVAVTTEQLNEANKRRLKHYKDVVLKKDNNVYTYTTKSFFDTKLPKGTKLPTKALTKILKPKGNTFANFMIESELSPQDVEKLKKEGKLGKLKKALNVLGMHHELNEIKALHKGNINISALERANGHYSSVVPIEDYNVMHSAKEDDEMLYLAGKMIQHNRKYSGESRKHERLMPLKKKEDGSGYRAYNLKDKGKLNRRQIKNMRANEIAFDAINANADFADSDKDMFRAYKRDKNYFDEKGWFKLHRGVLKNRTKKALNILKKIR